MARRHSVRPGLSLVGAMLFAACSTYTPVGNPVPGVTVRAQVPIQSAITNRNSAPQLITIEGIVVSSGDTVVLATKSRQEYGAFREIMRFDTVRVARDELASLDLQEFSAKKSVALGVGLTAAATYFAVSALGVKNGEAGGGPDGDIKPSGTIVLRPIVGLIWRLISNE